MLLFYWVIFSAIISLIINIDIRKSGTASTMLTYAAQQNLGNNNEIDRSS